MDVCVRMGACIRMGACVRLCINRLGQGTYAPRWPQGGCLLNGRAHQPMIARGCVYMWL